ncbi:hypothetical protein [Acidovorax soli]|uniref:hypothetical protein n=1 Tax=Acidovorax soli TaxID=592050 RepID=UPI0032B24137
MSAPTQAPVFSAIFLALLCSACSPSGSSQTAGGDAAAAPAAPAAQAAAVSYEIVTETRPKDFAAYKKFQEDAYTLCANTLKLSQRAVVPITEVSPDSSLTRETWTSDGKNFLYKSEVQALGLPDLEAGCQQKPGRSIEYRLTQADGSHHHWGEDSVRGPTPLSSEAALEQMPPLPTPSYSREKTVNGIALRCPSAEEMRLVAQVAEETCFIDTLGGHRVRDADGRLIGAYTVSQFAGAALHVVQVPISAKVQLAVNPALFKKP